MIIFPDEGSSAMFHTVPMQVILAARALTGESLVASKRGTRTRIHRGEYACGSVLPRGVWPDLFSRRHPRKLSNLASLEEAPSFVKRAEAAHVKHAFAMPVNYDAVVSEHLPRFFPHVAD